MHHFIVNVVAENQDDEDIVNDGPRRLSACPKSQASGWANAIAWENEVGWEGTRPVQRAEFIAPQMRNGVNRINEIQDSAPALSDI